MSQAMFLAVPLACLFCSLFLFLAVLSSKMTKLVSSFLILLGSFVLWTGGSVLMRMESYPGMLFWYYVSATGIITVPLCFYNFMYYYTNRRAPFTKMVWMVVWAVMTLLNLSGLFIRDISVQVIDGVASFQYESTYFALIPLVLSFITFFEAVRMAVESIRKDGVPRSQFTPLLVGAGVMFLGIILGVFLEIRWLSTDTIFCGVNAICLYYALYYKRILTLTPIASHGPVYLMAITFTSILGALTLPDLEKKFSGAMANYDSIRPFLLTLLFSLVTIAIYSLLRASTNQLFIKSNQIREKRLSQLSYEVSATLDMNEIIRLFQDFLLNQCDVSLGYICMLDQQKGEYQAVACTRSVQLLNFALTQDNPLIQWLEQNNQGITMREFSRTKVYRSLWGAEKDKLKDLGVDLFLPIKSEDKLMGLVLVAAKSRGGAYSASEISFMESATSIVAIGFKNAVLYNEMQKEARRDPLTGLYNRSYFLRKVGEEFAISRQDKYTLLLISMDDFRLFNELYGSLEGDNVLKTMADILQKVVAGRGMVARYAGKEFMVSLPFRDAAFAQSIDRECREWLDRYLASSEHKIRRIVTFSSGICSYPTSASTIDDVITYTNMAVYSAKKSGKNKAIVYSEKHNRVPTDASQEALRKREIGESCASTIYALTAAIDAKDHYTFNHSENVARYASILAEGIDLDSEHVEIIRQAGLLHDIGKIGIPERILSKKGRLTDEEFEIMKQHVEGSIAMIRHLPSLDYVIPAAIGHHERWDGRGYPRGIAGENIPLGARCLALADTFDAMTTSRPYRDAMSVEEALQEIERCLGTQFDPVLGRKFIDLVRDGKIVVESKTVEQQVDSACCMS